MNYSALVSAPILTLHISLRTYILRSDIAYLFTNHCYQLFRNKEIITDYGKLGEQHRYFLTVSKGSCYTNKFYFTNNITFCEKFEPSERINHRS